MPLKIRTQPGQSVRTPSTFHVQLFIDSTDGAAKIKDSTGAITNLTAAASGPAGGDLSGQYPNPSVVSAPALKTVGAPVDVSHSPAPLPGQILVAATGTSATWQNVPNSNPSGQAGGDLSGQYPNPQVVRAQGLKNSSTTVSTNAAPPPSPGQILTATSAIAAIWQDPPASTPSGPAGGDLTGTYPNPLVVVAPALRTSTGVVSTAAATAPTTGQALIATGATTATWQSPSGDLSGTWTAPVVVQARGLKSATTTVTVAAAAAPSAGQILTATSPTAAAWQDVPTFVRNSIWDPPISADPANEEFTSDPFLGGTWVVKDSNGVTQTRAGNVDPSSYPALGQYRSTRAGSTVYFQVHRHASLTYYLYKPVPTAISTEQLWMCGIGTIRTTDTATTVGANYAMFIAADLASAPDFTNAVEVGVKNLSPPGTSCDYYFKLVDAGVGSDQQLFSEASMIVSGLPGFMIRKGASPYGGASGIALAGSTSVSFGMFSPYGAVAAAPSHVSLPTSFSGAWAWAGFKVKPDNNSNSSEQAWAQIFALHFIRRKPTADAYIYG